MEKVAMLILGVTEPHPIEDIACTWLIAAHWNNADKLDAVGFFAVSSWFGIYQYHMWLWHAYVFTYYSLSGLHSSHVNVCSVSH